ncbi:proline rich transmembrane protein 1B [Pithys albifrons albifrons]|uniref:proline rich transmembrane protein 1B n=1 Tax=Pithys albifrons albifrons TaxID=3385563 RepID=UPI003A5CE365
MDGDGPQSRDPRRPDPTRRAPGAEQGDGRGAGGDQPSSSTRPQPPVGRVALEEEEQPARNGVQFACPLHPPGCFQQAHVHHQPRPGPGMGLRPEVGVEPQPSIPPSVSPAPQPTNTGHLLRLEDKLEEAVVVTLLCCPLTGILAIIQSFMARAALSRGDMVQAHKASIRAKWLIVLTTSFGWIIYWMLIIWSLRGRGL